MNQKETASGKTVDEAVAAALEKLGVPREYAEVTVLQQPETGMFGLFGKKEAIVEVTRIERAADRAEAFLKDVLDAMGVDCTLTMEEDDDFLRINLLGEHMGILIGRRGQTLDALQYLTSLAVNKNGDEYTRVILDTENYRTKRQKTLEALADKMADKCMRYHKRMSLEPMNPAERRIIHARLQNNSRVVTFSEGNDPYRHVVIQLAD